MLVALPDDDRLLDEHEKDAPIVNKTTDNATTRLALKRASSKLLRNEFEARTALAPADALLDL